MPHPFPLPAPGRPDYAGGGFVNLIATLVEARGGRPRHAPLDALPVRDVAASRNVVLLIVDGLGSSYLDALPASGHLARRRRGDLSAVFLPTTASAITTSFTGATPLEHGLTGWYSYFGATGCVGAPLPYIRRGDRSALNVAPEDLYREPAYFPTLADRCIVVTWNAIAASPYNRHHNAGTAQRTYADLDGLVEQTVAAVRSGGERKFIYAYWWQFDALAHEFGLGSAQVRAHFDVLDAAFGRLMERLAGTDTLVIATADHGFIDCPQEEALDLPVHLARQLRYPLCGERRLAFCHVQDERAFLRDAREYFGARADVRPSRALLEEGWFGPGAPHPQFAERIGDVALVMQGRATVKDWLPGEPRHLHIGNHGGISADELRIPLILGEG